MLFSTFLWYHVTCISSMEVPGSIPSHVFHFFCSFCSCNNFDFRNVIPLRVLFDGTVNWQSPFTLTTTCTMDVTDFPYDAQYCVITVGSWQYRADEVDIHCGSDSFDTSSYVQHTQWNLEGTLHQFSHLPGFKNSANLTRS